DVTTLEMAGTLHDPRNVVGRAGTTGNVWLTMINGDVVYADNKLVNVDEKKLAKEGEAVCDKVLREPCEAFHNLF
ncbi:MAG: amidohydrolase, partial [Oscillospiraceae bacterium]